MTRATPRLRYSDSKTYPVKTAGPSEQEKARNLATWNAALELADGDARRLRREPDGTITLLPEPRRIFLCSITGPGQGFKDSQKEIPRFIQIGPPKI